MKSRIFFTADTHFNHSNIIKYCNRPFLSPADRAVYEANGCSWHSGNWKGRDSVQHRLSPESVSLMDKTLLDNINNLVGRTDELWILGDFAFAKSNVYYETCKRYRDAINCDNVNIVWGNHDEPDEIYNLFQSDHMLVEVNLQKQRMVLCHYAMAVWNKSHRGAIHLYGHSHSGAEEWLERNMPGRKSLDVGVDNAFKLLGSYRPFALEEILDIVNRKPGHSIDHHVSAEDMKNSPEEYTLV